MLGSLQFNHLWSSSVRQNNYARSLRPAYAVGQPASFRLFNTNTVREYDRDVDVFSPRLLAILSGSVTV
ncbi:hypothetical protein DH2020_039787 [Rehmannia glutinosa]|uniref:Uncharacterized protein n=1 Tax=Rehmannia glutinosa TaxID=99300 RepID=A0ABR0UV12_REHGL